MAIKREGSSKKVYIAIFFIVILIVATAAIIYATQPPVKAATVGVHAGDSFTYSIVGTSTLTDLNAVETPGFSQYNQTDYYKITITGVNGTSVSFDTLWRFINGTEINGKETINLSNGNETVSNGFWAIYSANLNVKDLLRPTVNDGLTVNLTDTKAYADSTRERNFWFIENQFFDVNDPTRNTLRDDYTGVYFDKQTGMLETLNNITYFNSPLMTEAITWKLVNSTVWAVQ
jgi:hypothetical protein